jgi:hypothetical protein
MRRKRAEPLGHQVPELALDPVAVYGVADRPAHHEPGPNRLGIVPQTRMHHHGRRGSAHAATNHVTELSGPTQPVRSREHGRDQAASRARPLRRRAPTMARPARVRMRRRKPCVLCRRRLFGWNVRLVTGRSSQFCVCEFGVARQPGHCGSPRDGASPRGLPPARTDWACRRGSTVGTTVPAGMWRPSTQADWPTVRGASTEGQTSKPRPGIRNCERRDPLVSRCSNQLASDTPSDAREGGPISA